MLSYTGYGRHHYPMMLDWWKAYDINPAPSTILPKTGIVASFDRTPVCAMFLIKTDTPLAIIEYLISNPDIDKDTKREAIVDSIKRLIEIASRAGHSIILAGTDNKRVHSFLSEVGFKDDENDAFWVYSTTEVQ